MTATTERESRWPDVYCGTWWYCRECWIAHERDCHSSPRVHPDNAPVEATP